MNADTVKNFGIGGDAVISLMKSANIPSHAGYKLYFDNYFSSLNLFQHLAEEGYCAAATIQENRIKKCPLQSAKQMAMQSRKSYDFQTSNDEDVLVLRWKDNRVCTSITTYSTAEEKSVARWSREEKKKVMVPQPKVFADYNKGMASPYPRLNSIEQLWHNMEKCCLRAMEGRPNHFNQLTRALLDIWANIGQNHTRFQENDL
jgi:hypothetical protein